MKDQQAVGAPIQIRRIILMFFVVAVVFSCSDDPQPVNEEELITTLIVDLTPIGGGEPLELKFFDEDGDGDIDPVITPALLQLNANTNYTAEITLLNESTSPTEDITEEIEEEMNDHLFCFKVTNADVTVGYEDEDDNGYPVGLNTKWEVGDAGAAGEIQIVLRHQPGTKNGDCPGTGDSDIQVEFPIQVIE